MLTKKEYFMRVKVIASGSTGNCTYVETKDHKILIDTGVSKKTIDFCLNSMGVEFNQIDTVLITHEHDDHIRSLAAVLRKSEIMCYMTTGTYDAMLQGKNDALKKILVERLESGYIILLNRLQKSINYTDILLDDSLINVLPTFHDASEPVGYKISCLEQSVVYITDTGYVHNSLYERICNSDCYVLEFNHDPGVLMASDRSLSLKRRILSDKGHLSNLACADLVTRLVENGTTRLVLGHLSKENNIPQLAFQTSFAALETMGAKEGSDYIMYVAGSDCREVIL